MKALKVPHYKPAKNNAHIGSGPWGTAFDAFTWTGRLPKIRDEDESLPILWHKEAIRGLYTDVTLAFLAAEFAKIRQPARYFGRSGFAMRLPRAVVQVVDGSSGILPFDTASGALADYCDEHDIFLGAILEGGTSPVSKITGRLAGGLPANGNQILSMNRPDGDPPRDYSFRTIDASKFIGGEVLFLTLHGMDWEPYWMASADPMGADVYNDTAITHDLTSVAAAVPRFQRVAWKHYIDTVNYDPGKADAWIAYLEPLLPAEQQIVSDSVNPNINDYFANLLLADIQEFFDA